MSGAREDPAVTVRLGRDARLPFFDHLLAGLGEQETQIKAGLDAPPVTVGRFEVRRRVGAGGMGTVFEATDPELDRRVALKICSLDGIDAVKAIEHEARCLAKLAHPNVVAVHEVVRRGSDVALVMEFVQGQTLRAWQIGTNPSGCDVLARYLEAARGLAAIHDMGVEHGDFKPENVMIGDDGRVRVVDFGIARASSSDGFDVAMMGTRSYMAPERLMEQPGGPQGDVFAFCVSVWESLFGALPFTGKTVHELLAAIEAGQPATGRVLPGVPEDVRAVLMTGLSARASDRPQSMEALIRALTDASEGHRQRRARVRRWIAGGLVAAVLSVGCIVLGWTLANEAEAPGMDLGPVQPTRPGPDEVDQILAFAESEARDGEANDALRFLELAWSRARRDEDADALRRVAEEAMQVGELLRERGHIDPANESWAMAKDIYIELNDRETYDLVRPSPALRRSK